MSAPREVLDKVSKLLSLARGRGSTAGEAAAAMAAADALMLKWKISEVQLGAAGADPVEERELFRPRPRSNWEGPLAAELAQLHGCFCYASHALDPLGRRILDKKIMIVGADRDVEIVHYLFRWLVREVNRLLAQEASGMGPRWRHSFAVGCVETIIWSVRRARRDEESRIRAAGGAESAALMVIDSRSAVAEKWVRDRATLSEATSVFANAEDEARWRGQECAKAIQIGAARNALGEGQRALPGVVR